VDLAAVSPDLPLSAAVAAGLGLVVGGVMGLTGAGGTLLAVPLLMAALGLSLPEAVPVSLLAVAIGATVGAWRGFRESLLRYRAAALIATAGLLISPLGLWLGARAPTSLLLLAFAGVLLLSAGRQLWRLRRGPIVLPESMQLPALCPLNPDTGRFRWTPRTAAIMSAIGGLAGGLSGLLGVGGGFIVLPALLRVSRLSFAACVATTLMVLALVSTGTLTMALLSGRSLLWSLALPFAGMLVLGLLVGQRLGQGLPPHRVQAVFALLVLGIAGRLIYDALS
jgi:uncharacterized protein